MVESETKSWGGEPFGEGRTLVRAKPKTFLRKRSRSALDLEEERRERSLAKIYSVTLMERST
jgi:hypothetical protein